MAVDRAKRRYAIFGVMAAALIVFLLVLGANFAHNDYAVPLDDFFLAIPLIVWNVVGVILFIAFLVVEIMMVFFSELLFEVRGLSPDQTGTHLNVRCRDCGVVHWVEDTGERPMSHFCPNCGKQGQWGGPDRGNKDFIYTQVEVKIGCTNCHTTFLVPEPLVRPLWAQCPSCEKVGVLKEDQMPVDAEEVEITCTQCDHAYHVYAPRGEWDHRFVCPSCGKRNVAPEPEPAPADEAAPAPTA